MCFRLHSPSQGSSRARQLVFSRSGNFLCAIFSPNSGEKKPCSWDTGRWDTGQLKYKSLVFGHDGTQSVAKPLFLRVSSDVGKLVVNWIWSFTSQNSSLYTRYFQQKMTVMVTFGLFLQIEKDDVCSDQNLNVSLFKILLCILGYFQQKITEIVTFGLF